ncbi:cell division ATP-binding protein FtsE [Sunxiuqinia sp. A32]|uniref:cell division ATP-binding protein FtsE n=1 Tax=Sunxiuqinia sp. A32 TaxID=3461496 RepID=UPI0040467E76
MENAPIISLQNVDVFQQDKLILTNVNLQVAAGEFVYLIGKVGSGKSSLIKILNAELDLFAGEANVAGFDLKKIRRSEVPFLRRKLGVVFQDFRLLSDRNIYENLAFVLKATGWKHDKSIKDRVHEMIEKVGMKDKLNSMPHELSGGEQQRVVIARALLNNPEIILADEPTGNLDPETSEDLMSIFKEINAQGKTILMATHDYPILNKFPARTIICADQKVAENSQDAEMMDFSEILD